MLDARNAYPLQVVRDMPNSDYANVSLAMTAAFASVMTGTCAFLHGRAQSEPPSSHWPLIQPDVCAMYYRRVLLALHHATCTAWEYLAMKVCYTSNTRDSALPSSVLKAWGILQPPCAHAALNAANVFAKPVANNYRNSMAHEQSPSATYVNGIQDKARAALHSAAAAASTADATRASAVAARTASAPVEGGQHDMVTNEQQPASLRLRLLVKGTTLVCLAVMIHHATVTFPSANGVGSFSRVARLAAEEGLRFLSAGIANDESMNEASSSLNEATRRALTHVNEIIDLSILNTVPMATILKKQLLRDIMEQAIDHTLSSGHVNVRYLKAPCAMLSSTDCHSRSVSGHQVHVV